MSKASNDRFMERISNGFGTGRISDCGTCKHWVPGATFAAFPDGIPDAILDNEHDHRQPYPGDHGIRWEPKTLGAKHPLDAPSSS